MGFAEGTVKGWSEELTLPNIYLVNGAAIHSGKVVVTKGLDLAMRVIGNPDQPQQEKITFLGMAVAMKEIKIEVKTGEVLEENSELPKRKLRGRNITVAGAANNVLKTDSPVTGQVA